MLNKARLTARSSLALSVALFLAFTQVGSAAAQFPSSSQARGSTLSPEARDRVRQLIAAVGLILVRNAGDPTGQAPRPRGSAVVVQQDGLVVTNHHVIAQDQTGRLYDEIFLRLSADGMESSPTARRYRLKTVLVNKQYDLALLRVVSDEQGQPLPASFSFPTIELGDSKTARLLDDLIIIGFPEKGGTSVTVNSGVIEGKDVLENWIKTDARLIHGNSGGAAVDSEGRLIGIPTKIIVDSRGIDTDGDGIPDTERRYGAVGFLRPAHLVKAMLDQFQAERVKTSSDQAAPQVIAPAVTVLVRGIIKSATDGRPIAGASVGLLPLGSQEVTAENILTWAGTNAEGQFELNKPVPPGRYTLKAKALGYDAVTREVEISPKAEPIIIELIRSPD